MAGNQLLTVAFVCSGGVLASQSRGAMLALGAGLLIAAARQARLTRQTVVGIVVVAPLVVFALTSVQHQVGQHQINSLTYRADYTHNVKRWRDGQMVLRWVASALSDARDRFRALRGFKDMPGQ